MEVWQQQRKSKGGADFIMSIKVGYIDKVRIAQKTVDRDYKANFKPLILNQHRLSWALNAIPIDQDFGSLRICDLGCHNGTIWPMASVKDVSNITFVDMAPQDHLTNFILADIEEKLPFIDKEFDVVLEMEILEHVVDPLFCIKDAMRISKKVIITVPYEIKWGKERSPFIHMEHIQFFHADNFKDLLEASKFHYEMYELHSGGFVWLGAIIKEEQILQ